MCFEPTRSACIGYRDLQMDVGGEKVEMDSLISVEGENTLRRIGAIPFWEVRL